MITSINPIDGRYSATTAPLIPYFSEYALIKYRLRIEIEYLLFLSTLKLPGWSDLSVESKYRIQSILPGFNEEEANKVKALEKQTNHDIKALEYYLKEKFNELGLNEFVEFIHFGLTSQDINNTAIPLSLKEFSADIFAPVLKELLELINQKSEEYKHVAMLARTHGQPASPTDMGKEWKVFVIRLKRQIKTLEATEYCGKFGGATGNFNAHFVAYPQVDWFFQADQFVNQLGLIRSHFTTQIEHYDQLAEYFQSVIRINTILTDFCRDIWTYISMDYFTQKTIAGEVGSSAMPHKVNPIDFENAEGNLSYATAISSFLAQKLPISRLQRDLTDSTVLRNIGVPLAHTYIAIKSIQKGILKLEINLPKIAHDLSEQWAVLAEAIQTVLRREGVAKPYELLKELTRGNRTVTKSTLHEFIRNLPVNESVKRELLQLTPQTYLGRWDNES